MSNDGPYYHKKVYINSMENWGTTARKIYLYTANTSRVSIKEFEYGSEMWSRIYICIDLLRYIDCTFS